MSQPFKGDQHPRQPSLRKLASNFIKKQPLPWGWLVALGVAFGGLGLQWAGINLIWLAEASKNHPIRVYFLMAIWGLAILASPIADDTDSAIGAGAGAIVGAASGTGAGMRVRAWPVTGAWAGMWMGGWAGARAGAWAGAAAGAWVEMWTLAMDPVLSTKGILWAMWGTQLLLSVLSYVWALQQTLADMVWVTWFGVIIGLFMSLWIFFDINQSGETGIAAGVYLGLFFSLILAFTAATLVGAGKRLNLRPLPGRTLRNAKDSPNKAFPHYWQRLAILLVPILLGFAGGWHLYPLLPWANWLIPPNL